MHCSNAQQLSVDAVPGAHQGEVVPLQEVAWLGVVVGGVLLARVTMLVTRVTSPTITRILYPILSNIFSYTEG